MRFNLFLNFLSPDSFICSINRKLTKKKKKGKKVKLLLLQLLLSLLFGLGHLWAFYHVIQTKPIE